MQRDREGWSVEDRPDAGEATLQLVIFLGATPAVHTLPASGSVVMGRAPESEVRIDDASVSRRHAILHLDGAMKLEDLGSANGTWLRPTTLGPETARLDEGRLVAGERVDLAIGQPFNVGTALAIVRHAPARSEPAPDVVVLDASMKELYETARRIAETPISVLLLGETGTGKEVLAETIHRASPRAQGPFVRLNCAALSEALLESELFGHERGSFTGATTDKPGLLEVARGGTVFLDEIGELPASIQAKLLRVIEERKVLRVGALAPRAIDVRFVSATWRDLQEEVDRGAFRRDLFFRLDGISLRIPPLRERPGEIRALAELFLERARVQMSRGGVTFAAEVPAVLERHNWPGNIRELRNVIERAVALSSSGLIREEHLALKPGRAATPTASARDSAPATPVPPAPTDDERGLRDALVSIERKQILDALEKCAGNQTEAAALLGISRRTLINRLERFGIARPRKRG